MAGWEQLGDLIGGGMEARKETAFQNGRYRSAQTEDALTNARVNQAKAMQTEAENNARSEIAALNARNGIDYTKPDPNMMTQFALGGLAPALPQLNTYQTGVQEYHNRETLGSETSTPQQQLLAAGAIKGEVQNPYQSVGPKGYVDLRNPDAVPAQVPGGGGDDTPTGKDYATLMALGGPDSPAGKIFMDVKRQQYATVDVGGVPTQTRRGATPTQTALATPEEVAANAAAKSGAVANAAALGKGMAGRILDAPQAKSRHGASLAGWDGMIRYANDINANEDLWKAAGLAKSIAAVPGFEGAKIRAQGNTLKNKIALTVLTDLRNASKTGGALGNVSDKDISLLENNIAALNDNLSPADYREQLGILIDSANAAKQRIDTAYKETYPEAFGMPGVPVPGVTPAAPAGTVAPQTRSFNTEAEAVAAGVKPGERVTIGGVSGTWE